MRAFYCDICERNLSGDPELSVCEECHNGSNVRTASEREARLVELLRLARKSVAHLGWTSADSPDAVKEATKTLQAIDDELGRVK